MIVSLIGYRGTGKTTVGQLLAKQLELPFFDSDVAVTEESGSSIADIFASKGETYFRQFESQVAEKLMKHREAVISWGGGIVLSEFNRELIRHSKMTIWLQASAEVIDRRLNLDHKTDLNRPALTDLAPLAEIKFNLEKREPLYRDCANFILDTDEMNTDQIVQAISREINRQ